jgi:hypothetical protein
MHNGTTAAFKFHISGMGYAKQSQIVITQDEIVVGNNGVVDFGNLPLGKARTLNFSLGNTGEANITFSDAAEKVRLADDPGGRFTVSQQPETGSLATGQTVPFSITFKPDVSGTLTAFVAIETNSSVNPLFSFQIKGSATETDEESQLEDLSFSKESLFPYLTPMSPNTPSRQHL